LLFGILLPLSSVRNHIQLCADFRVQVKIMQYLTSNRRPTQKGSIAKTGTHAA
jgi:hypothetical protein